MTSGLPPSIDIPPDYLTIVAMEFHEAQRSLADRYAQPALPPWAEMPEGYQQWVRQAFQTLAEHETIARNWWRG